MFVIWNVDAGKPVSEKRMRMRDALRYAAILEGFWPTRHYSAVRL